MDAVAFEDDLESAQRDAERLRGDALVERARIIAEALREGERLAAGVREEAAARLAEAERDALEWLSEADEERERLLAEARALGAEIVGEAEEQAEAWLKEVDAERARLEAEAEEVRTGASLQASAMLAAAAAVTAARLDDVDAQIRGLLQLAEAERDDLLDEAGAEAERLVAAALERRGVIEDELDGLRIRLEEARGANAAPASTEASSEEASPPPAAPTATVVDLVPVLAARAAEPRRRRPARVLGIAAAVATVALVSAGAVGLVTRGGGNGPDAAQAGTPADPEADAFRSALQASGSDRLVLTSDGGELALDAVVTADGEAYVDADALPALAGDRTYQLWADADGAVVPLVLLGADPDVVRFAVPDGAAGVEVTEEDEPGASTPSADPVVSADL